MLSVIEEFTSKSQSDIHHRRPSNQKLSESEKATTEIKSISYIEDFWPYLCEVIYQDPQKLGLTVKLNINSEERLLKAEDLKTGFIKDNSGIGEESSNLKLGSILSSIALMEKSIAQASEKWAHSMKLNPRYTLPFTLRHKEFVSLRMLFPEKHKADKAPSSEAPTLVTGGTMTAIYLCWNLLMRSDSAYSEAFDEQPSRQTMENIWRDTRELIFRLGNGSLTSFISLASACSSNSASMIWDGMSDIELINRDNRYTWCANDQLVKRYSQIFDNIVEFQNGEYSGCAALFARAKALPLSEKWADKVEITKEQNVFSELIRWITAVARKQYFSCFDD